MTTCPENLPLQNTSCLICHGCDGYQSTVNIILVHYQNTGQSAARNQPQKLGGLCSGASQYPVGDQSERSGPKQCPFGDQAERSGPKQCPFGDQAERSGASQYFVGDQAERSGPKQCPVSDQAERATSEIWGTMLWQYLLGGFSVMLYGMLGIRVAQVRGLLSGLCCTFGLGYLHVLLRTAEPARLAQGDPKLAEFHFMHRTVLQEIMTVMEP
eukprot:1160745-Pelagomonas_calceolata.AAC.16